MAEGAGTRLMYRMRYITKLVKLKCNFDFKFKNDVVEVEFPK